MKTVVNYTVTGADKNDVKDKALQMWRKFEGDPDAALPSNTFIQFHPDTEHITGDGTVTLVEWSGDVIISQNTTF